MGGGTKKMSWLAFMGGMTAAFIVDTAGILIPALGSIFIGFMKLSFWLVGYDMRKSTTIAVTNGFLELFALPPSCMIFMALSYKKNKKNCKERKEKGNK